MHPSTLLLALLSVIAASVSAQRPTPSSTASSSSSSSTSTSPTSSPIPDPTSSVISSVTSTVTVSPSASVSSVVSASPTAAAGQPLTLVQPFVGTVFTINSTLNIFWSLAQPVNPIVTGLQLVFNLEDLRKGISTGVPLSPSLGTASVSAGNFTTPALSTLFTGSNAIVTGTNYTVKGVLTGTFPAGTFSVTEFFSPQFTIQVGPATTSASSSSSTQSTMTVTATSSKSGAQPAAIAATGFMGLWTFLLALVF